MTCKMINGIPEYACKVPEKDFPTDGDIVFLIEKMFYVKDVTARHKDSTKDWEHILIEKKKQVLFEFITNTKTGRGCIFSGNGKLIYCGSESDEYVLELFNLAYYMAEVNRSNFIEEESKHVLDIFPECKSFIQYTLPILNCKRR